MNALTTCNACEAAPMAPGQDAPGMAGYCQECLDEAAAAAHAVCRHCGRVIRPLSATDRAWVHHDTGLHACNVLDWETADDDNDVALAAPHDAEVAP